MASIYKHLAHLETSGLIQLGQTHPELEYLFRHALVQDAAYKSLLRADRKQLHRAIAESLERLYPNRLDELASSLGQHFAQAEEVEKAVHYLYLAGKRAVRQSANEEAVAHFNQALAQLETLPDTSKRAQQELDLQIGLGNALIVTKGYAAPEVGKTYNRARELSRQVDETLQLFPVLFGLSSFYFLQGEIQTAREIREEFLHLAERRQDPALLATAHRALGLTLFVLGELTAARAHLEQALAFYNPERHRSLAFLYAQDPKAVGLAELAWVLWYLGYPDQALQRSQEALAWARELSHPHTLAYTLCTASWLHQFRREASAVRELTEEVITLTTGQGFKFWQTWGTILQGRALAMAGQGEEGIAQIRQGLNVYRATGIEMLLPNFLSLLAETYVEVGRIEQGLNVLAEARAIAQRNKVGWHESEIHRLKGVLLLKAREAGRRRNASGELSPEACFLEAIDIARQQSAKSLELRAVMSLSRLWREQGKKEEARQMLAEIYDRFTAGFETVDLKEAKALLEELSQT